MSDHVFAPTVATMARAGQAGQALVWWLFRDPRVQRVHDDWCLAHGLTPGVAFVGAATMESVRLNKEHDLAMLSRLVREDLG